MKPLAGYVRVSHVGGRAPDRFHADADQIQEIESWAKAQGRTVEILPPELDAKGSDPNRPILREAVEGVKAGRYEGVVVAYLSRAGRDLRLMLDLWDEVEAAGGIVYFARENIDASTNSGRLQRNILASFAQHELEERRDGFDRAAKGAVERGIWQRRQTPRGYSRDPETRRLVPDERADDVRDAFRRYVGGESTVSIGRRLSMSPGGARNMLRNRVYLGELKVREYVNPAAHPAIIDTPTFEAAQSRAGSNVRPAKGKGGIALLAGLVRCASCGHVMTRGPNSKGVSYKCPTNHSGGRCPSPVAIACRRLDDYVERIAVQELSRLEVVASEGNQVAAASADLAEAKRQLEAFMEQFHADMAGSDLFELQVAKRMEAVRDAEEALRAASVRAPIPGAGAAWPTLTAHDRNALLRSLFDAVIVRPAGRGRTVPVQDRCRVIRYGSGVPLPKKVGSDPIGIVPLSFPDLDDEAVLIVSPGKDAG